MTLFMVTFTVIVCFTLRVCGFVRFGSRAPARPLYQFVGRWSLLALFFALHIMFTSQKEYRNTLGPSNIVTPVTQSRTISK